MPQDEAVARSDAATRDALEALRREIDGLDASMLALVERRVAAAMGIAELKRSEGGDRLRLRPAREAAVIDRMLTQAIQSPERLVRQVWREILACCLDLQVHTELLLWAEKRPAPLTDAMRRRFGCAARLSVLPSPAAALEAARKREAVAVIELSPDSDWWTALKDDPSLAIFEALHDDEGTVIGLAVGRIAAEDLHACPAIRIVAADEASESDVLAAAGDLRLVEAP
jgi:chorismate mutase